MTREEHINRHKELHKALDELFADFIAHAEGHLTNTVHELVIWAYQQTQDPDHGA